MSKEAMCASLGKDPAKNQDHSSKEVIENLITAEEVETENVQGVDEAKAKKEGNTNANKDGKNEDKPEDKSEAEDRTEAEVSSEGAVETADGAGADDNVQVGYSAEANDSAEASDNAEASDSAKADDSVGDENNADEETAQGKYEAKDEAESEISENQNILWAVLTNCTRQLYNSSNIIQKTCLCCKFEYFNHDTCATNYVNNYLKCIHHDKVARAKKSKQPYTSKVNLHSKISIHQFNQSITAYYCKNCQQKQCFKCKKEHTLNNTCRKVACLKCGLKWLVK